jgi:hypothetical protein
MHNAVGLNFLLRRSLRRFNLAMLLLVFLEGPFGATLSRRRVIGLHCREPWHLGWGVSGGCIKL